MSLVPARPRFGWAVRAASIGALLIIAGGGGCGSGEERGDSVADTGVPFSPDAGADGAPGCPSAILCGTPAKCCGAGQECVLGKCLDKCATGAHCRDVCCGADQVCVGAVCGTPTTACEDSVDCAASEYCELSIGKCLPSRPESGCAVKPPAAPLAPTLKWSFTTPIAQPASNQAISAPLVVDVKVNGQHSPAVFFTSSPSATGTTFSTGYLRRLDGKTGAEAWTAAVDALQPAHQVEATFAPAVADLEGDGLVDVVAMGANGQIVAFDGNGAFKWSSHRADASPYVFPIAALGGPTPLASSTIAVADLDADGHGEVVLGGVVFDATGVLVSGDGRDRMGGNGAVVSSIVADVDGDGQQEVLVGNGAFRRDGSPVWTSAEPDGFPAIADFERDGIPELVVATGSDLRVLDARTGVLKASLAFPLGGPGSPVIADFSGTGAPEIGVQLGCAMTVYHYDGAKLTLKWQTPLVQCSGTITATAFDFNGDGQVEVLAHDDCRVSVLDGATGATLLSVPASHATWSEFVSVADIDGNGVADLLFSANDMWGGDQTGQAIATACAYTTGEQALHGVFVYSDPQERWMPTRRVWNQQAYHITNIRADGALPKGELASWGPSGWNNYRVSAQGKGASTAPDLVVSLTADVKRCPATLDLVATITNLGTAGAPAGIKVDFFAGPPGTAGAPLGTGTTAVPLLPGASTTVSITIPPPPNTSAYHVEVNGMHLVPDCVSANDVAPLDGVSCDGIR